MRGARFGAGPPRWRVISLFFRLANIGRSGVPVKACKDAHPSRSATADEVARAPGRLLGPSLLRRRPRPRPIIETKARHGRRRHFTRPGPRPLHARGRTLRKAAERSRALLRLRP